MEIVTQPRAFPFHLSSLRSDVPLSGIRASEPDMRYSGDAYFDNKNMMDLRIISTMGLTEDDVKAASKQKGSGMWKAGILWTLFWQTVIIKPLFMSCLCFRR